ncbi:hypothetical protein [Paraburkholderia sp. J41]|uniref:hypothetical protein n=1 Tax=Paraburkholderia sp. J41 TaxID=2805433 RepID=UPI002AC31C5D|nr:hypothetical protein [Paraburkholderia sp. J41]
MNDTTESAAAAGVPRTSRRYACLPVSRFETGSISAILMRLLNRPNFHAGKWVCRQQSDTSENKMAKFFGPLNSFQVFAVPLSRLPR